MSQVDGIKSRFKKKKKPNKQEQHGTQQEILCVQATWGWTARASQRSCSGHLSWCQAWPLRRNMKNAGTNKQRKLGGGGGVKLPECHLIQARLNKSMEGMDASTTHTLLPTRPGSALRIVQIVQPNTNETHKSVHNRCARKWGLRFFWFWLTKCRGKLAFSACAS